MRNYKETLAWYRTHQNTQEIGFDPDGMCLKICRTARGIGSVYPSAKAAQDATPDKHRHHAVKDLRKGMVLYFDDPNDSNRFGHIVTMIGRVDGFDPDDLGDVLVETNSVKANEVVVVRADYFQQHWGDRFQFGADWLNGQVLDVYEWGDDARPSAARRRRATKALAEFKADRAPWKLDLLEEAAVGLPHLKPVVAEIKDAVRDLPQDNQEPRIQEFLEAYRKHNVLRLGELNNLVAEDKRYFRVKASRDRMRKALKTALR